MKAPAGASQPRDLRKSWSKLVSTLQKKAPSWAALIASGTTEEALDRVQRSLGTTFSPLLREFLILQGGELPSEQDPLFEVAYLLPLEGPDSIIQELDRVQSVPPGSLSQESEIVDAWTLPRIPIAIDFSGNFVAIDGHTPGKEAQVLFVDFDAGRIEVLAPDLVAWVQAASKRLSKTSVAAKSRLETTFELPDLTCFDPGSTRSSPQLEQMGLSVRRLETRWADDPPGTSDFLRQPPKDPARTFVFTIEDVADPTRTRFFSGGDSELVSLDLVGLDGRILSVESGSLHRRLHTALVMTPVWYLVAEHPLRSTTGLRLKIRAPGS